MTEEQTAVIHLLEYEYLDSKGSYFPHMAFTSRDAAQTELERIAPIYTHRRHFITPINLKGSL